MKKIFILLFLALIFLTACSKEKIDDSRFEETTENVYVKYENGMLSYKITIEKPTPCHIIVKDEKVMESYPVQVAVDLTFQSSNEICIQIISKETVEGEIYTGNKPGSFEIKLNELIVYSTNFSP